MKRRQGAINNSEQGSVLLETVYCQDRFWD